MAWYSLDEALNTPQVPEEWAERVVVGDAQICRHILASCDKLAQQKGRPCRVALDGYLGVDWNKVAQELKRQSALLNLRIVCVDVSTCYRPARDVDKMVEYCLKNDPYFGYVYKGSLRDFLDPRKTTALLKRFDALSRDKRLTALICYGVGATVTARAARFDRVGYFDITRETLVGRIEKEQVRPLATRRGSLSARLSFKRLSYVDHIILNKQKQRILDKLDWYIDANDDACPKLVPGSVYEGLLRAISEYPFRLKPVYMPGVWGGQYLKRIRGLPSEMVNCAFCFEVIPQEQAVRVAIGKTGLEIPSYNLLYSQPINVMGQKSFKAFGYYFPVTANYDDTYRGGHLAIQVHPDGNYLRRQFNERTQRDESYYAVKTWKGARTYHGLKDETDLEKLRKLSLRAERNNIPFDHDKYVNSWSSRPGDLFLIPAGTVHASGGNQLVLELDLDPAWGPTEYTFHIYDYLRRNLDGTLRTIHIDHAFAVIRPERRTRWVAENLKQKPRVVRKGKGWAEYSLGTYREMRHSTHRLEFEKRIECETRGRFHVLALVKGKKVLVHSLKYPERQCRLKYTEALIVPACMGRYAIVNLGKTPCHVTKSFLK